MILDNVTFDKIKLVYKLSDLAWFIERHAKSDAQQAGDSQCLEMLTELHKDLTTHLERLQKSLCIVTQ
jgi:hypothetical protein